MNETYLAAPKDEVRVLEDVHPGGSQLGQTALDPRALPEVLERASLSQQAPEVLVEPRDMKEGSEVEMFADPSNQLGGEAEQAGQRSLRTKTLP
jgi:hypothetical protein